MQQSEKQRVNQERFRASIGSQDARHLENSLMNVTNLAGLFYPEDRTQAGYALYAMEPEETAKPLHKRLPPHPLRHYYGYKDGKFHDDLYIKSGENDMNTVRALLQKDGFDFSQERMLEFGCSAGRLMRHLEKEAHDTEIWGVDIHSAAIHWAQAHLSPPFNFATVTTTPHLPFEDNYFGFIFAGSVWTHIGELDDAWLLEMRRVLRPGGRLYITISDENTLSEIQRISPQHPSNQHVAELDEATGVLSKNWTAFITRTTPWLQRVVYKREAWLSHVSRWLEVRVARPSAYGWQTGVLLAKRTS